jgi:hypothetical protein
VTTPTKPSSTKWHSPGSSVRIRSRQEASVRKAPIPIEPSAPKMSPAEAGPKNHFHKVPRTGAPRLYRCVRGVTPPCGWRARGYVVARRRSGQWHPVRPSPTRSVRGGQRGNVRPKVATDSPGRPSSPSAAGRRPAPCCRRAAARPTGAPPAPAWPIYLNGMLREAPRF